MAGLVIVPYLFACVVRIFTVWNLHVQCTRSKLSSGTRTVKVNSSQREYQAGPSNTCVVRIFTVWNLNVKGTPQQAAQWHPNCSG